MYLKQVTIDGFKSFADKTVMNLIPGVTCIVGPNGCGKSNIVDAIRWVLGEQSAKALRGGKMQDVIFQGTESRKPLQFCEVSLLFSDCEAQLGTNFNEVEITRRVTRDGGSDYYINGKTSRLKDIQTLFMDTGIGRVSYSFMVQGQIDQILSSNPGERRSIFEEAAGITKYKTARREALNKLALVDQNLARATDRLEEIGRQIGSLKRQAAKALRFKRLSYRLKHLDLALSARSYAQQNKTLLEDEASMREVSAHIEELSRKMAASDEELSRMRTARAEISQELEQMRAAVAEIRSQKEQAERNSEFADVRKKDLLGRIEQIEKETASLEEQLQTLEGQASGDAEVKQMQLALVSDSDEVFKQKNEELAQIEAELRNAEAELSRAKQDALVAEGAITKLRVGCTSLEVDLKSYQVRHAALSDAIFQVKEENITLERKLEELRSALSSANARATEADAQTEQAQAKSDELRAQYRAKQADIQQMDRQVASKSAKLGLLNEFQSRMEGFSDGAKAVIKGRLGELAPEGSAKLISQCVEISDGWGAAFEALLGSAIDAIALGNADAIPQVAEKLRDENLGRACFASGISNLPELDEFTPPDAIQASSTVKCSDELTEPFAKAMLKGCWFCEDVFKFADFAKQNANFKFFAAADRNGNVLDARGAVFVSGGENRDTESSVILRNQEIKRLKDEIQKDNDLLTELNEVAMAIQSSLSAAEQEIETNRAAAAEVRRQTASMNAQINSAETLMSEKNADIERKGRDLATMENSRFEAQDRLDSAKRELEQAEKTIADSRVIIEQRERDISVLRESKDQKNAAMGEIRLDLAEKKSRLESLERGIGETRRRQEETRALVARRREEALLAREQIQNFEKETGAEIERAKVLAETLNEGIKQIDLKRTELDEREKRVSEFETSLIGDREILMRANSQKGELDVRAAKARSKLDFLSDRIRVDYELEISGIDWKSELWKADEEFQIKIKLDELEEGEELDAKPKRERGDPTDEDLVAMDTMDMSPVEDELRHLREKIAAMGAVNLVAIEEYAELKERYDFLKAQTDDLWTSKNALVADIDEINNTSQKMFADTFEQIKKNFAFTFEKLFGGGSADLRLVESEDVLDSGIEIIARPPGTMLKSLSLLSGGQRTMTAVSLLFAIYMVKPSPFCVLDELDAPLDDANIGRYTDILKEFTKFSQFLVISHNKRTVSAAQTIYGVTMQERGVTRLISMRFNEELPIEIEKDAKSNSGGALHLAR